MFRETANFIRKTLCKAQLSCSSLICSLWYIDQYFHQPHEMRTQWHPRELFLASIVVADKYLTDITWLNADWSEWTHHLYSTRDINRLEMQFLEDMDFKLHVTETEYSNFCSYLEFRVHLRQVVGNRFTLSYRDIDVLSQSLCPVYCERLKITLRPFEAMLLFAKTATSLLMVYTAVIATLISTGYVIIQHAEWIHVHLIPHIERERLVMLLLSGIDMMKDSPLRRMGDTKMPLSIHM
ncbi:hypothetical protein BDB01DRAFT_777817 [Pilobolus umbonatus]|nr:hypothetical protein BDB01DRAFT_777817 [Pilobolus umbonatus]